MRPAHSGRSGCWAFVAQPQSLRGGTLCTLRGLGDTPEIAFGKHLGGAISPLGTFLFDPRYAMLLGKLFLKDDVLWTYLLAGWCLCLGGTCLVGRPMSCTSLM